MKTEKTFTDDHQVRVTAEFEQDTLEGFKRKAARKIAKSTRIPGFRPGKAPYAMILNHVGEGAILEEAIDLMLNDVYPQVLEQESIEPYGPGNLEDITSQEPPVFVFLIPLAPETELVDVESLRKPYEPPVIEDKDVDEFITKMRQNEADIVPVEGEAEEGHLVYMTLKAIDENPSDPEDNILMESAPQQTTIPTKAEEQETEWPFKGFARKLLGRKAEDQLSINHTYPDEDKQGVFSGKTVRFDVNIQSVKRLELAAIDEEFLAKAGGFETEDDLREAVREKLKSERITEYDDNYYLDLVDTLREKAIIKYPPQMLEDEEHEVLHRIEHNLEDNGMDLDLYLKLIKMEKDEFIEAEVNKTAKERLERSLIMDAITKNYDVKPTPQQVQSELTGVINSFLMSGEYEKAEKQLGRKGFTDLITNEAFRAALNSAVRHQLRAIAAPESMPVEEEPETPVEGIEVFDETEIDEMIDSLEDGDEITVPEAVEAAPIEEPAEQSDETSVNEDVQD